MDAEGGMSDLLALSDERDVQLELRHRAYREGYVEGSGEQWAAGYAAAIADVKRAQHQAVAAVDLAGKRMAPGGTAWLATVERNGGTEYGGAGQPRVPVDLAVIEAARKRGKA